jgi:hypothetical protein
MKKSGLLIFLSFCIGIALLLAACGPDRQLGYQAVLTAPGGIPVANGSYTVNVKFWNDPTSTAGADLIYQDTQSVTVTNGMLNIAIPNLLTEADNLDPAKFAQPLWAEVIINGETLSPRQKLLGTPYAFSLVGGAVVMVGDDAQAAPLITNAAAGQGAFNVSNRTASSAGGSPGTGGLTVSILDGTDSYIIRGCGGGLDCSSTYLEFRVSGNGNVTADGSFTGGGADYAEMITAEGSAAGLEPGDVLVISATQDRAVAKSSRANDPSLAGVYSTEPGFVGGGSMEAQPGYVPVAMMGIVPVKVTAANGPIHRGDLLTSSDIPGYAMLATDPQIGAILGKAMGELLEGQGVIEIQLLLR